MRLTDMIIGKKAIHQRVSGGEGRERVKGENLSQIKMTASC